MTSSGPAPAGIQTVRHGHRLYRLVRAQYQDALDTSHSQRSGGRWNPADSFPVLYTACSRGVARAIARDLFAAGLIDPEDLMPGQQPELAEVEWAGNVVDVASSSGVAAAGFAADYPHGIGHAGTQPKGSLWHDSGHDGVLCRSASLERMAEERMAEERLAEERMAEERMAEERMAERTGEGRGSVGWSGACTDFAETAIFVDICSARPRQVRRKRFADWF